ncbi:MAG: hypothetical protein Q4F65_12530 [Propionibacteriaceae bacterium]|nr:hypothetical protein [Propionibacteriaceae bacterium]
MSAAADAAMVLGRASAFDPRVRQDDPVITAAWAEAIARHNLDRAYLLNAVTDYYSEPRERSIGVGDVIRMARDARQRDAMVDNTSALAPPVLVETLPPGSGASTHMGVVNAAGAPIEAAYRVDDAIDIPCPDCRSDPGVTCGCDDYDYRIPCVARLAAAHKMRKACR